MFELVCFTFFLTGTITVSWGNTQGKNKGVYDTNDDDMVDNIEIMVKQLLHENKIKEDDVQYIIKKFTNTIDNTSITGEKVL